MALCINAIMLMTFHLTNGSVEVEEYILDDRADTYAYHILIRLMTNRDSLICNMYIESIHMYADSHYHHVGNELDRALCPPKLL